MTADAPLSDRLRARVEAALQVTFRDPALLAQALTHVSLTRELDQDDLASNERLEFLGDAVIQLAVSEHLFRTVPDGDEGVLSTCRAAVVRKSALARVAREIHLEEALRLGRSMAEVSARGLRTIAASALEAVLGAVLLDQGWETARACALRILEPRLREAPGRLPANWKGDLQEWTQERLRVTPAYRLVDSAGPGHERRFEVEVWLGDQALASGRGASKKEAEQEAAATALRRLQDGAATSPD